VRRGECFEDRYGVNSSLRHDPFVRPAMIARLLLEERPNDHDDFGLAVDSVYRSRLHATGSQVQDFAHSGTDEV
jgi:hypothetical protein